MLFDPFVPLYKLHNIVTGKHFVSYKIPMCASKFSLKGKLNIQIEAVSTSSEPVSLRTCYTNTPIYKHDGTPLLASDIKLGDIYTLDFVLNLGGYQILLKNGQTPS